MRKLLQSPTYTLSPEGFQATHIGLLNLARAAQLPSANAEVAPHVQATAEKPVDALRNRMVLDAVKLATASVPPPGLKLMSYVRIPKLKSVRKYVPLGDT
jgi:hypothetical protein